MADVTTSPAKWSVIGILGIVLLVLAAGLAFGVPAGLAGAGVALILAAIDGRR